VLWKPRLARLNQRESIPRKPCLRRVLPVKWQQSGRGNKEAQLWRTRTGFHATAFSCASRSRIAVPCTRNMRYRQDLAPLEESTHQEVEMRVWDSSHFYFLMRVLITGVKPCRSMLSRSNKARQAGIPGGERTLALSYTWTCAMPTCTVPTCTVPTCTVHYSRTSSTSSKLRGKEPQDSLPREGYERG
jgi:hypothetical protein